MGYLVFSHYFPLSNIPVIDVFRTLRLFLWYKLFFEGGGEESRALVLPEGRCVMAEPAGKMEITQSFSGKSLSARLHTTPAEGACPKGFK